jgi:ABC-type nitrate/sulfonate/bicarbonate transport system ATPase subunit
MHDISFAYESTGVLFNDLNIEVCRGGQIKCVLGPSGVGKSTLLQLAMGEKKSDSGKIKVNGLYLPMLQNFESMVLPWFSARTNITWGLDHTLNKSVEQVAKLLEIQENLDLLPRILSGGQRQRMVLARALVRHPELLLLDEPLANLDSGTERRILPNIRLFLHEQSVSALWVTHNVAEALMVADAICVLHEGGVLHEFPVSSSGGDENLNLKIEKLLL